MLPFLINKNWSSVIVINGLIPSSADINFIASFRRYNNPNMFKVLIRNMSLNYLYGQKDDIAQKATYQTF